MAPLDERERQEIVSRVQAAQQQRPQRLAQMREWQQQGLEVARKSACILKADFGASRGVYVCKPQHLAPEHQGL